MATEAEILETIIEPMAAMYGRPFGCRTDNEAEKAQAEYLKTFRGMPLDALEQGWADIRREWSKRTWPSPADIYNAAKPYIPSTPRKKRDDERISPFQARQLLNATREGAVAYELQVPASFLNFSVREGRTPTEQEIRQMAAVRLTPENIETLCSEKIESGTMSRWLKNLGMAIYEKNQQLCAERSFEAFE